MYIKITYDYYNGVTLTEVAEKEYSDLKNVNHYQDFENGYIFKPLKNDDNIIFISFMKCENKKEFFFSKIHQFIINYCRKIKE